MDAVTSRHPSEQTLQSYGFGKLDDLLAEAVDQHLEQCPDCRQRVAAMTGDSFLGRIRGAQGDPEHSIAGRSMPSMTESLLGGKDTGPPPAHTLPPGLADHADYEIKRELGRGGMGVVYLAHNTLMGRDEVLKVMGRHIIDRPGVLDRFQREIRAVAQLRHPNIVSAYTAFRIDGGLVFAMEYVDGLDLARLVKVKGPMPVGHAAYFAHQAALGLQHAFERGMVHRDIKPHNLMLTHEGKKRVVKILDFGLAKATREGTVDSGLTHEGQALGTPDYIAPEQIQNALHVDIRADLYSLGGTLYFLLTGHPPFQATSLYDLYQAHISRDADPLNLVRPEVPSELAALVAKLMAKDPSRRFQTPAEAAEALVPFFKAASPPIPAPRPEVSRSDGSPARPAPASPANPPAPVASPAVESSPSPVSEAPIPAAHGWTSLVDFGDTEDLSIRPTSTPRKPDTTPTASRRAKRPWIAVIAASVLMLGTLIALGIVISIKTDKGTIRLKNLQPGAVVTVDGERVTLTPVNGGDPVEITVKEDDDKTQASQGSQHVDAEKQLETGQPNSVQEKELVTNSIGMKLKLIPAGSFLMGATTDDEEAEGDEKPQHRVTITRPFYIGVCEVTQYEYKQVMGGENPSHFKDSELLPVEQVSWFDAVAFCNKLSERERRQPYYKIEGQRVTILGGNGYRLPTEAEWEYACRAPQSPDRATKHPFGTDASDLGSYAWFEHNSEDKTHPVGQKQFNRWGLFDMQGNVREWCQDWYSNEYYEISPETDPLDPATASDRVSRGGSWYYEAWSCRPAYRFRRAPVYQSADLGFRVAASDTYSSSSVVDTSSQPLVDERSGPLAASEGDNPPKEPSATPADSKSTDGSVIDTSGYVKVFDGKRLFGFVEDPINHNGECQIRNGMLILKGNPIAGREVLVSKNDYRNFRIRARVLKTNDSSGKHIAFRHSATPDSRSGYFMNVGGSNAAENRVVPTGSIDKAVNRPAGVFGSWQALALPVSAPVGQVQTIELEVIGNHFVVFVNGTRVVEYEDSDLASGQIALYAWATETLIFKEILLQELDDNGKPPAAKVEGNFEPLFNGKDRAGWVASGSNSEGWKVEDGCIVMTGSGSHGGFLSTTRQFTNFRLHFEFQLTSGANSGVFLSLVGIDKNLEVNILDDSRRSPADVEAQQSTGSLWWTSGQKAVRSPARLKKYGEWNVMDIESRGTALRVGVNGRLVNSVLLNQLPGFGNVTGVKGPIALQNHTGTIRFREVRIQEISEDGKPPMPPTESETFVPLFNGKDLDGWADELSNGSTWEVAGEKLTGRGSGVMGGPARLATRNGDYANFRLRAVILNSDDTSKEIEIRRSISGNDKAGYAISVAGTDDRLGHTIPIGSIERMQGPNQPRTWAVLAQPVPVARGTYHTIEISAVDNRITTTVNGRKVAEFIDREGSIREGQIVLVCRSASWIEFKSIMIQEIP